MKTGGILTMCRSELQPTASRRGERVRPLRYQTPRHDQAVSLKFP